MYILSGAWTPLGSPGKRVGLCIAIEKSSRVFSSTTVVGAPISQYFALAGPETMWNPREAFVMGISVSARTRCLD